MSDHPLMPTHPTDTTPFTVSTAHGRVLSFEAAASMFAEHPEAQRYLHGTRHRVLRFEELVPQRTPEGARQPAPTRYRAIIYDYTNNRTVLVEGDPEDSGSFHARESGIQPLPSDEEFEAAAKLLANDPKLGPEIRAGHLIPYRPMPPLLEVTRPDGRVERTVAVGLFSEKERIKHRLAGVNMLHDRVLHDLSSLNRNWHIEGTAGHRALFSVPPQRGPLPLLPPPGGGGGGDDDPGEPTGGGSGSPSPSGPVDLKITLSQGSTVIWEFTVVRPSLSSGTNGSGIELKNVRFRGKTLLYRAHTPIVNVQYLNGLPPSGDPAYRDWTNQEVGFQAVGVDLAPGFRQCTSKPTTIFDPPHTDGGNFKGVALFNHNGTFSVTSMMKAGWYRYLSEWRFNSLGMLQPRWGFTAIDNPNTSHLHVHHAYWRFDFDLAGAASNVVMEYNNPPIVGDDNWHTKKFETLRLRDASHKRAWSVKNNVTGHACAILPGPDDGDASANDPFAPGDLWVLRYHFDEIDDHQGFTTNPFLASVAQLNNYKNGESVDGQDIVVWYGAGFRHTSTDLHGHIIGPTLLAQNFG